jgi:ribosomal protein S18 acetylase RimI-like enzyme
MSGPRRRSGRGEGLRRCGLGRLLVAHCERLAHASGLAAVELFTNAAMTGAQHLYSALGYTEVARGVHEGFTRVFYRKVL